MFCETLRTTPDPEQVGHVRADVPGSAPLESQRSHGSATSRGTLTAAPGERLLEIDLHDRLDVSSTPGAVLPSAGPAEEIVSEERCEDVRETSEVGEDRLEATPREAGLPEAVVRRTALGVGQHLERLGDVSEPPLRVGLGGDVGVQLARERAERALDLGVARSARDA